MEIFSAITTCPRSVDYLEKTLESVRHAGFFPLIVEDTDKKGSWPNFKTALLCLLQTRHDDHDALVVFQDDIEVAAGLFVFLRDELWPGLPERVGAVSLYCAGANHQEEPGWHDIMQLPEFKPFGACAYVIPVCVARKLVLHRPEVLTQTDTLVGQYCRERKLEYWIHSPSLVQHIGKHSAINDAYALAWENPLIKQNRTAAHFCADVREL